LKPPVFDYVRPDQIEQVLDILFQEGDEARILAGGQSLVAMLNMRVTRPSVLIDIMHLKELAATRIEEGHLLVPAGVRQVALEERTTLTEESPLLAAVMPWIGHVQTRARGTVCGSIAHADPSAELPLTLSALEGLVQLRSAEGRRATKAKDFFLGMMVTAKSEIEFVEAIKIPLAKPGMGVSFREIGRRHGDFAIVSCAAVINEEVTRLAVGGVNDVPTTMEWIGLDTSQIDDALNEFAWSLDARDDLHATACYRRKLVRRLGRQVLEEARKCTA
jgi:2-furoyl-CoA dehydrogenase FAD binding subunit